MSSCTPPPDVTESAFKIWSIFCLSSALQNTYFSNLAKSNSERFSGLDVGSMNGLVVRLRILFDLLDLHQPRAASLIFSDGP